MKKLKMADDALVYFDGECSKAKDLQCDNKGVIKNLESKSEDYECFCLLARLLEDGRITKLHIVCKP